MDILSLIQPPGFDGRRVNTYLSKIIACSVIVDSVCFADLLCKADKKILPGYNLSGGKKENLK